MIDHEKVETKRPVRTGDGLFPGGKTPKNLRFLCVLCDLCVEGFGFFVAAMPRCTTNDETLRSQRRIFPAAKTPKTSVSSASSVTSVLKGFCFRLRPRRAVLKSFLVAAIVLTIALLAATGCKKAKSIAKSSVSTITSKVTLKPSPMDLNVGIDSDANKNSPVAVDVVLIKDKNFWKTAPSMTAKDWFAQKSDLQRRYQSKLQVSSWEWVPGQPIEPITMKIPRWLKGAMVFANYPTPGTHSAPLPLGGKIKIALQAEDFTLVAK